MNNQEITQAELPRKAGRKRATVALIAILGSLTVFALTGSGVFHFAFATARCMKLPVATSSFMASYSYILPGEKGYGPGISTDYKCSEQEAKDAGFRHSTFTDAGAQSERSIQRNYEEEKRFGLDKIDFKVYIPTGSYTHGIMEISAMGSEGQNKQVFFPIKKDGYVITQAREGKIPNDYELCTGAEDYCTDIGTTTLGSTVKKQVANRDIVYYGAAIGSTFINLSKTEELDEKEVIDIFNSLSELKQ